MNSGEAINAGEPQAEELVGPALRFEHVKCQNL